MITAIQTESFILSATPFRGVTAKLAKGALITLKRAQGWRVYCRRGLLWITEYGRQKDFIISSGQSHVISTKAAAIVNSVAPSEIDIHPAGMTTTMTTTICTAGSSWLYWLIGRSSSASLLCADGALDLRLMFGEPIAIGHTRPSACVDDSELPAAAAPLA